MSTRPTNLPIIKHVIPLSDVSDISVEQVQVEYLRSDRFHNHWIMLTLQDESQAHEIKELLRAEYVHTMENDEAMYDRITDPIQHHFGPNNTVVLRLARAPNFTILEKEGDITHQVYCRHEKTNSSNIGAEGVIADMLCRRTCDVDVVFAGAFETPEGPMASIVCRRVYLYPEDHTPALASSKFNVQQQKLEEWDDLGGL